VCGLRRGLRLFGSSYAGTLPTARFSRRGATTPQTAMASLLNLCDELLHEVFTLVKPDDLASLARTCQQFNAYVTGNKILWKDAYAVHFVGSNDGSTMLS